MEENPPILETTVPGRPAIPDVLQEHLEEVSCLAVQRRKLLFSPDVPLRRLPELEERVEAHLDGLRVGVPASIHIAETMLEEEDPWFVFAAARFWVEARKPDAGETSERLRQAEPGALGAWREAFRQLPPEAAQRAFPPVQLDRYPDPVLAVALDAWAWHGILPQDVVTRAAASPDPGVRRALSRHAGQTAVLRSLLEDPDTGVRRRALWELALREPDEALSRSRAEALGDEPDPFSLRVLGLFGDRGDVLALLRAVQSKTVGPTALRCLLDLACPEVAGELIDWADGDDPELAPVAAEVYEAFAGRVPEERPDPPPPGGVSLRRHHWAGVRTALPAGRRLLSGRPFPWEGERAEEPLLWVWRRLLKAPDERLGWLRKEVPDGFWGGESDAAVPGE